MKVLKQAITADGINIRLEDWREDFSRYSFVFTIAAYPRKYVRHRAEIDFETIAEASAMFDDLATGILTVLDAPFTVAIPGGNRSPLKPLLEQCRSYPTR